jgi:acetyl-CoA acetyltransferase
MAVATGVARTVVVYRALNERSGNRFGAGVHDKRQSMSGGAEAAVFAWYLPFGLVTPAGWVAMSATRYMHEFGATSEDFGRVAVAARRPCGEQSRLRGSTEADHARRSSGFAMDRRAAAPARLLSGERWRRRDSRRVGRARARSPAASGAHHRRRTGSGPDQHVMTSYYRESIVGLPEAGIVARQLWEMSGLGPRDIRTAILYDHFTPFVLIQLEEFGFCARGEAKDFVRDGNIELGGRLPLNPNGGQLARPTSTA